MGKTIAETIGEAARRESQNRSELIRNKRFSEFRNGVNEAATSQNIFTPGKVYTYLVDLYDQPITLKDFAQLKPSIRATHGFYTIQYIPAGSVKRNPKFPYLIGQDLVRIRVTVSGPKHWRALCSRIPELGWVNRNSTISDGLFGIAKKHPGLVLRFGIDFVKYCDKITDRANELGVDIDNKPLVLYQWGADDVPKVDGVLNPLKTKQDYAEELKAAQSAVGGEEEI